MTNFISRAEAEELCDGLIQQFIGNVSTIPESIDIDAFVRDFLKCPVLYESIVEDDKDRIAFVADGKRPLRVMKNGQPKEVVYPRNTIVLDKYLLNPSEYNHRRFVLSHEAGHVLANRINPDSPACFHHFTDRERINYTIDDLEARYSINEWQANTIGASLLMPRYVMKNTLKKFNGGRRLPIYGDNIFHPREKAILNKMASTLQVSFGSLNAYDIENAGNMFYYFLSVCNFYGQYYDSISKKRYIYLEQANMSSKLLIWFEKHLDELNERLCELSKQVTYQKKMTSYYDVEGRLMQYPSKKPLRLIALSKIADCFETDRKYSEKEVNEIIRQNISFSDIELIRREMFQYKLIGRLKDGSEYWREDV